MTQFASFSWLAWFVGIGALVLPVVSVVAAPPGAAGDRKPIRVYLGTYTGESRGIYVCELDRATGKLSPPRLATEAVNPSFLAISPDRRFLYSVGEISDFEGKRAGGLSAWSIDAASGSLTLLNQQSSGGAGPCHVSLSSTGRAALVANYGGGSVASFAIAADGRLEPAASFIQHTGSSVDRARQEGPHAHSVNLDPGDRFAIVADLGLDRLMVYRFDAATAKLTANDPPFCALPAGGGPRHFAFHPGGHFAYANNEMSSTVSALAYDAKRGAFTVLETVSTLPADASGENNSTAEVRVHPSGQFVYVSNRGHDSIAVFAVDSKQGTLRALGHVSSGGKIPRNFNIDPSGNYLLAANQDSGNVVAMSIDTESGMPAPTGSEISVPKVVCVRFFEL